jgi:DNA-binding MarR family transcriptional regulator
MTRASAGAAKGVYSAELEEIRRGWEAILPDVDASPLPFFVRIAILANLYEVFCAGFLGSFGLPQAEYETLGILRSTGRQRLQSPTELARFARQTTAGMTKTLDRLERGGLARRRPHPSDRRRVEIVLTRAGAVVTDRIFRAQIDAQHALLKGVSATDRSRFNRVIEELGQRFAEHTGAETHLAAGGAKRSRTMRTSRHRVRPRAPVPLGTPRSLRPRWRKSDPPFRRRRRRST